MKPSRGSARRPEPAPEPASSAVTATAVPSTPAAAGPTRAYRGESAEARQQQRREKLLEAALDAFAKHGYNRATMRDICAGARLSERYFYESFRNTSDAFEAVYDGLTRLMWARIQTARSQAEPDFEAVSEAGLRAFFSFIQEDPRRARVMLIDAIQIHHSELPRAEAVVRSFVDLITSAVGPLTSRAPIHANPRLIAHGLVGMTIHLATGWWLSHFREPLDDVVAHAMYAWRGLVVWLDAPEQKAPAPRPKTRR